MTGVFRKLGKKTVEYRGWEVNFKLHYCGKGHANRRHPEYSVHLYARPNDGTSLGFDFIESERYREEYEYIADPSLFSRIFGSPEKEFVGTNADEVVQKAVEKAMKKIDEAERDIGRDSESVSDVIIEEVTDVSSWATVREGEMA